MSEWSSLTWLVVISGGLGAALYAIHRLALRLEEQGHLCGW